MTGMDPGSFHKIRSLDGILRSLLKGEAPHDTSLPLRPVMEHALLDLINQVDTANVDPRQSLLNISTDLEQWQQFIAYLLETSNRWYTFQSREWTFSRDWWRERFTELASIFRSDPQQGVRQWIKVFTDALVEWDLHGCQELVEQAYPFPDYLAYLPMLFEGGVEALVQGRLEEAEDMIAFLIQPGGIEPDQPTLDDLQHALILVLSGRITGTKENPQGVEELYAKAIELAPQDGRPRAAMGDFHRSKGEFDPAAAMYKEAVRLSPDQPEGYTGMALLMEEQSYWEEAQAWYRQAVDCALSYPDPYRTLTRLLAPVSGNLYYHLAIAMQNISERWALPAIEHALELGVRGNLAYPDVEAYALKGKLLRKLRKNSEAGLAYYEAGRRSGWNLDYETAVQYLRLARKLNPTHQHTCWYLADDLRLLSFNLDDQRQRDTLLNEGLQVWEQGIALGELTKDNSWALFTRALFNEVAPQRRKTSPEQLPLYDWEAIFYTERNLLISNDKAYQWTYLARFYRMLNLNSNNQYVLDRAWELDPSDDTAREEKIIRSTNRGDYQEALELLKPYLTDETHSYFNWAHSVHGYILCRLGKYEEALQESDYNPKENWVESYRRVCYMRLGDLPKAREILESKWQNRSQTEVDFLLEYAYAGLHLALMDEKDKNTLDESIEYVRHALTSPTPSMDAYAYLGFALLAQGQEMDEAQRMLEESIRKASNKRELSDLLNIDIPILQELMSSLPHSKQIERILDDVRQVIQAQIVAVELSTPTPEEEILAALEWLEGNDHPGMPAELVTHARLGARASLARLHLRDKRWQEAAQEYHAMLPYAEQIPEARFGLENSLQGMRQAAETTLQQRDYQSALPLLELRAEFAQYLGDTSELPEIHCQLSFAHLCLAAFQAEVSLPQAALHLQQSAKYFIEKNSMNAWQPDAWQSVAECLHNLLPDIPAYWQVDTALGALLAGNYVADQSLRADLHKLRQALDDYLGEIYQLQLPYTGTPATNRIAIELGSDLLPPGPSQEWDLLRRIDLVRRDLYLDYGQFIPGVHIRIDPETLAPDEYRILIDGQQVALQKSFLKLNSNVQAIQDLASYPLADNMKIAITYNLERFMSLQAVSQLLVTWQKINAAHFLGASRLLQDNASLLVFWQVLLELAREQVPVNRPGEVLTAFLEIPLSSTSLPEIVTRLRMALRPHLPGNTPSANRISLPADLEAELSGNVQTHDGLAYLVMTRADQDRLLARINDLLVLATQAGEQADETNTRFGMPVLICQAASLRPLLRRLIATTLPQVAVLSAQEVLTEFPTEEESSLDDQASQAASSSELEGDSALE